MIQYYLKNPEFVFTKGSEGAAGYDVKADIGTERIINPGERWKLSTGLFLAMPKGVHAEICSRSGLAINHGIVVANAPGIVDSDYRGEVFVTIANNDRAAPYVIHPGDRIAQIIFHCDMPSCADIGRRFGEASYDQSFWEPRRVEHQESLGITDRGQGGHGSTGR